MIQFQRVIYDNQVTESDISLQVNDFRSGETTMAYQTDDFLYLASDFPFNHRFIEIGTANDVSANVSVEIWWANNWYAAVDVIDRTSVGGKSLAQSGIIQWSTNRLKGWDSEQDSEDVTGIAKVGIYNKYWVRFSWSANLKATTSLKFIGHKFSTDDDLVSYWPDMANTALMTAFETGKTSWDEQHFMAAETIISDLKQRNITFSPNQILDFELFRPASCHKVAEIVYQGLGRAYEEQRALARKYYDQAMNKKHFNLDQNANANLEIEDQAITVGWLTR